MSLAEYADKDQLKNGVIALRIDYMRSGEVGAWRWSVKKIPSSQYGPFFYSLQSRNEGKHGPAKTESEALALIDIFLSKKGMARVKTQTALFREYL